MKEFIRKHFFSLVFLIFAIIEGIYIYYVTLEYQYLENFSNSNIEKIDSLVNVINNRNDSIIERIDTITVKIYNNKNEFKQDFNRVSSFSVDSDIQFFSDYISEFEGRYISNNNSESAQSN